MNREGSVCALREEQIFSHESLGWQHFSLL